VKSRSRPLAVRPTVRNGGDAASGANVDQPSIRSRVVAAADNAIPGAVVGGVHGVVVGTGVYGAPRLPGDAA
jgi:hypothetical protein